MHLKKIISLIALQKDKMALLLFGLLFVKTATSMIPVLVGAGIDAINSVATTTGDRSSYLHLQLYLNELSQKFSIREIHLLAITMILLSVFLLIAVPWQQKLQTEVVQKVVFDVTTDWFERIFKKDLRFFKVKNAARTANTLNRGIHGHEKLLNQLINIILPVTFELALASVILIQIGGFVSLAFILFSVFLQAYITLFIINRRRSMISTLNEIEDESAELTQEILSKGLMFQLYKGTEIAVEKLKNVFTLYADQCVKISPSGAQLSWLPFQFQTIGSIVALILGFHLVHEQGHSMGQVLVLISFFARFSTAASECVGSFRILDQFKLDVQDAEKILKYRENFRDGLRVKSLTSVQLDPGLLIRDGVKLKIPHSIDFQLGDQIALIGGSGSGKSTLLEVFAGLDDDSRNILKWNGIHLADLNSEDHLNAMRYCPQDPMIFKGPFSENIFQKISTADRLVQPLNLDHLQDQNRDEISAKCISGGEAKRVAVVRALYSDANLYLMDEPTAGLHDLLREKTWDLIQLQTKNGILITVTHDEDHLERFNKILSVENGLVKVVKWEEQQRCGKSF